jgi:hypothetical protein
MSAAAISRVSQAGPVKVSKQVLSRFVLSLCAIVADVSSAKRPSYQSISSKVIPVPSTTVVSVNPIPT